MAVPYLNRDYEKNIISEVESLFVDYLTRHKLSKTLDAFMQECICYKKNYSQTSDRSLIQNSHSTIEDLVMNANFRENANKKYLFSTCKSFVDAIAENSHRLINLICENSISANTKEDLNDFKNRQHFSHPFISEGNLNNNRTFIYSQGSVHNGSISHDSSGAMSYETPYSSRFVSNTCSSNIVPSNLPNVTLYPHNGQSFMYRSESFALSSGEGNGFRPIDGSCLTSPGNRVNVNCDGSMDYGSYFVPNGSSTPRIIGNDLGVKKGTHVVIQGGNLPTPNYFLNSNSNKFMHGSDDHISPSQYGGHLHIENKNILNDNRMQNFSGHSPNTPSGVTSNSSVEVKEKKSRANSSLKSTAKSRILKEGNRASTVSKRKNDSPGEGNGKKVQKLDNGDGYRSGVLDFQTTVSPSQFRKAARDVDLEKEPHLAKQYSPISNQVGKHFKPENLLNVSKFKNEKIQSISGRKEQFVQISGRTLNSSLNISGFGKKNADKNKVTSSKDSVFKSPNQINSPKNDDNLMKDSSKVSSSQDQSSVNSNNFEDNVGDSTGVDRHYNPYELCQVDNSLEFNSECNFDLDSNVFYDPGRDLELFDEIGYCKNDG